MERAREPLIEATGVTFGYGREAVLQDVDLTVHRDDFLAILGPNGGGKTTLVKVLLGLLEPWSGTVRRHVSDRGGAIGYVPQFAEFDRGFPLRVRELVLLGRLGLPGGRWGPCSRSSGSRRWPTGPSKVSPAASSSAP
jgi:zinc transport system ATP-binding protein